MTPDRYNGTAPLLAGIMPGQHPEVLQTAATLAGQLGVPLVCAYVDEASYLVEWDPARSAHRLSLHPDADDQEIRSLTSELTAVVEDAVANVPAGADRVEWALRTLAGDPARALSQLAAETGSSMIIVGTSKRGVSHRLAEALNGSVGAWLSHHQSRPVLLVPYRMPAREDRR